MFERQERVALLLLVGVAVVVMAAHVVLTGLGKQPFARPFTDSSPDGELVVIDGQVDRLTVTTSGGHLILDVENISVFLPAEVAGAVPLRKGDRIHAFGTVQTYRGKKEVVVDSAGDIRITPAALQTPVSQPG